MVDPADQMEDMFLGTRVVAFQNALDLLYAKCIEIFEYRNLPQTLPKRKLERFLNENGFAIVYKVDGDIFVTDQKPSGKPDLYGENREVHIKHFEQNLTRTVGVDAVKVLNDSGALGLSTMLSEFALLTAQSKLTFLNLLINARHSYVIHAKDQNAADGAQEFLDQLRAGQSGVLLAEEFMDFEGVELHNVPLQGTQIQQAISLIQYIQSYYYSELGITLNNNMKSQYQNEDELSRSTGMPFVYNMLAERLEAIRDINALFDSEIEVALSGEWSDEIEDEDPSEEVPEETPEPSGDENDLVNRSEAPSSEEDTSLGGTSSDEVESGTIEEEDVVGDEPDEITRDELIDATETLLDEEVPHGEDDDSEDSNEDEDRSDSDSDEEERSDVDSEEDDDETRER